jgi:inorganic pyrophosphatase
MTAIDRIKPFAEGKDDVHVVIDTPRGSRNKLKWDRKLGVLKLSHVLTAGAVFPFDVGFVPGTHGANGDALDVLVLSDEPLFPLCLVQARLIGVIEAEQTQGGKTIRNDRMVAVAVGSRLYAKVNELDDLPPTLMDEIEQFFINYNKMLGSCNAERRISKRSHNAHRYALRDGQFQGLSRDLGPRGITINNVQPGAVDTDMNPAEGEFAEMLKKLMALPRYARVDEIAAMVAYLAGPEAGFVTGASLMIDGGFAA